jgi:glutathione S-transferase
VSPRGKVPVLETEHGFLSETSVILDYIEQTQAARRCCRPTHSAGQGVSCQGNRAVYRTAGAYLLCRGVLRHVGGAADQGESPADLLAGFATLKRNGVRAVCGGRAADAGGPDVLLLGDLACAVGKKVLASTSWRTSRRPRRCWS